MVAQRIMFLNVPLDIVPLEELPEIIQRLTRSEANSGTVSPNRGRDIVLLSVWDLLIARRNNEYRNYVLNAALIIPISKSLVSGARFLTGKKVFRYMPFNFAISLLGLLERQERSLYLLGSGSRILGKAEKNIRSTFPRLKIVGRCGNIPRKQEEPAVVEAIRKTSPSLLLAGKGVRGGELWIARNSGQLGPGVRLWCSDLFYVFAERRHRPSDAVFEKGLESIGYCLRNPLKFLRIFPYFHYKFLLLFYKLFRR